MRPAILPAKTEIKQAFDEMVQDNILDLEEQPEYFDYPYCFTECHDDDDESDKLFAVEEWDEDWEIAYEPDYDLYM